MKQLFEKFNQKFEAASLSMNVGFMAVVFFIFFARETMVLTYGSYQIPHYKTIDYVFYGACLFYLIKFLIVFFKYKIEDKKK